LARLLASLFRVDQIGNLDDPSPPSAADTPAAPTENGCSPAWTVQHLLLPGIRRTYEPPAEQASDHTVVQVACTEQLYKIFERC
jgi:DNA mismatch repair protein MLH1